MNKKTFDEWRNTLESKGLKGSFSVNIGEQNDEVSFLFCGNSLERAIHKAVYELDPDYACVAVIHSGDPGLDSEGKQLPVISQHYSLDDAALTEGIGHTHGYKIKESGLVVRFAYDIDELN